MKAISKENRKKILLGTLVLLGGLLFIFGIFFIGRKEELYTKTFRISTMFNNLNGLRAGDFVRFSGYKCGIVEKITFINDSMIKVDMKIESEMQRFIKKDVVAYIATEGLVGNKMLNLRPQWKNRITVQENDIVEAINPFNTEELITKLMHTNDNTESLTENLAMISKRINERKGIFETLISDTSVVIDMKKIIADIKVTGNRLAAMSGDFEKTVDKINIDEGMAGVLLTDTTLSNELKQIIYNLKLSSEYSAKITANLSKSVQNNNKSTFNMLMKDSTFAQNLRQSVINLQQSTEKLNESMEGLQHSILLRKYFKKKNKK